MKKLFASVLVVCLCLSLLTGCSGPGATASPAPASAAAPAPSAAAPAATGGSDAFVVGYSNIADTDRWCKYTTDQFAMYASQNSNVKLLMNDANLDIARQIDQVDNFILQGANLIILAPVDYAGVVPGIKAANDAGIPVICSMIAAESGDYTYVGASHYDAGKMQGDYLAEVLPQNAKVLYLGGTPGLAHTTARWEGFQDGCLKVRTDVQLLDQQTGNYVRAEGMSLTENWIQRFDQFDAIVAANDEMALGAVEALKGANRLEGVMVVGVDASYDACVAIRNGEMTLSVFQNGDAIGKKTSEVMMEILNGGTPPKENIVPFENVTKDNVEKYYQDYLAQGYGK